MQNEKQLHQITNWQYYTGNAPFHSAEWKTIGTPKKLKYSENAKDVWFRSILPGTERRSPALYIGQVDHFMQVYLNNQLIYQVGDSTSEFIGRNQNLIELPFFNANDTLLIHIKSFNNHTGFNGNVLLGSSSLIVKELLNENILRLYFAGVSFICGIICLIIFFRTSRWKLLVGIGFFLIPLAFFVLSNSLFLQLIYPSLALYNHLNFISLVSAKVGGLYAIEQIVPDKRKKLFRILGYLNFSTLVFGILVNQFTSLTYLDVLPYFLIQTMVDMLISSIVFIKEVKAGEQEIKILMIGFFIFFFFAAIEIILYFTIGLYTEFGYNVRSLYIGLFFLVLSLIWIVIHRFFNAIKQKEIYQQKELQVIRRENEAHQQFSIKLIESQENERNRIALELHDSIGQKLLLIKNQLLLNRKRATNDNYDGALEEITNLTGETIHEIRSIIYNLRPQYLDQIGLTTAIETMVEEVHHNSKIDFKLHLDDIDNILPKEHEINLFRIVQEGLNNIVKHSGAKEATVNISKNDNDILMMIKDNGKGFQQTTKTHLSGMGFTGMKERAKMIGAEINIASLPNEGVKITLKYNLK